MSSRADITLGVVEVDQMEKKGVLGIGTGIALGAAIGLVIALFTDLTIPFGIVVGAMGALLAMLVSARRR